MRLASSTDHRLSGRRWTRDLNTRTCKMCIYSKRNLQMIFYRSDNIKPLIQKRTTGRRKIKARKISPDWLGMNVSAKRKLFPWSFWVLQASFQPKQRSFLPDHETIVDWKYLPTWQRLIVHRIHQHLMLVQRTCLSSAKYHHPHQSSVLKRHIQV